MAVYQAPASMGFSRQEYWSGVPLPSLELSASRGLIWDILFNSREGNNTPFQYSCLENPMDAGAWSTAVYGVAQSRTRLKWLSSSSNSSSRGLIWASLIAQLVKNPPAMQETWVRSWVGKIPCRRGSLLTPVFWPREFHELYSLWGRKSWTWLSGFHFTSEV